MEPFCISGHYHHIRPFRGQLPRGFKTSSPGGTCDQHSLRSQRASKESWLVEEEEKEENESSMVVHTLPWTGNLLIEIELPMFGRFLSHLWLTSSPSSRVRTLDEVPFYLQLLPRKDGPTADFGPLWLAGAILEDSCPAPCFSLN